MASRSHAVDDSSISSSDNNDDATAATAGINKDDAVKQVYALFHRGGTAFTIQDRVCHRYYCLACLAKEIENVKLAREQYGQGRDVSVEVLRGIAMGRVEFLTPHVNLMLVHLRTTCENISPATRILVKRLYAAIYARPSDAHRNPYDLGSVFETTSASRPPKRGSLAHLEPGSASPARIFAQHESDLYERAKARDDKDRRRKRARLAEEREQNADKNKGPDAGDIIPDAFEEEQSIEQEAENLLFRPGAAEENGAGTPEDFPTSDLLRALQSHAGKLYASRGLMSSASQPRDDTGRRIPSMVQSMDGTALVALGILAQELTRSQTLPAREFERQSNLFVRKVGSGSKGTDTDNQKGRLQREFKQAILSRLDQGETSGMVDIRAALER